MGYFITRFIKKRATQSYAILQNRNKQKGF